MPGDDRARDSYQRRPVVQDDPAPLTRDDRAPAVWDDRVPARDDRVPARDDRAPVPIHHGRALDFTDNPGREYWWNRLDPNARTQLLERVGDIIDWWAYIHDDQPDRPYAVVFGRRGLAVTKPSINSHGKPANRLLAWSLREDAHRSVRVTGSTAGPTGSGASAAADRMAIPPASINLPAHVRGFLGNLPAEAQRQLQQPFTTGDLVRESDYHYWGYPERLDIWCFLAGSRTITFAVGTGLLTPGGNGHTWDLSCHQATVAGPAG